MGSSTYRPLDFQRDVDSVFQSGEAVLAKSALSVEAVVDLGLVVGQTHSEPGGALLTALSRLCPVAAATPAVGVSLELVLETVQLDLEDPLALGRGLCRGCEEGGRCGQS